MPLKMRFLYIFLNYLLKLVVWRTLEILFYVKLETPSGICMVLLEIFS